ncbi:hypothetical protein PMZ80_010737 [Knufia obscura]|uniref:Uncharacterized protein n=1 Tax=Knufia obscura TaxID=1635080 RepID=A0ABR0R8P4_9EURO|nr:hypothetical protein PMZ80_010737 [Knufia obscura]
MAMKKATFLKLAARCVEWFRALPSRIATSSHKIRISTKHLPDLPILKKTSKVDTRNVVFDFLRLPLELRRIVYTELFMSDWPLPIFLYPIHCRVSTDPQAMRQERRRIYKNLPIDLAVLHVSKQIRDEYLDVIYGQIEFQVTLDAYTVHHLARTGISDLLRIRHVNLHIDSEPLTGLDLRHELLQALYAGLRTLHLTVHPEDDSIELAREGETSDRNWLRIRSLRFIMLNIKSMIPSTTIVSVDSTNDVLVANHVDEYFPEVLRRCRMSFNDQMASLYPM